MCFAQGDARRNLGRDPVHQRMNDRDGAGKHRAVANRLRKKLRAPPAPTRLTRSAERAKQQSISSFEMNFFFMIRFPPRFTLFTYTTLCATPGKSRRLSMSTRWQ